MPMLRMRVIGSEDDARALLEERVRQHFAR